MAEVAARYVQSSERAASCSTRTRS
jgi:hypothetical protein